ncbi:hypothetical protein RF11_06546 [Thelohanellus kitauei]|uniref:Uncharacterized protein n=1 Tax=Thelohanellus kitauei TaxID=669202 RepID=A0A0C2IFY2_THEKT|nr:hypothetical protein RF11_06546 [Thelohanellus kitauei]
MSGLINGSKNRIQIDSIDKLVYLCGIFSVNLTMYLTKVESKRFKITNNKKQMLFIIYFTLVALPNFHRNKYLWLKSILIDLHDSLAQYFKKSSINDIPIENQLLILQCYIKFPTPEQFQPSDCNRVLEPILESLVTNPCY